ncbi:MAG TPA: PKD domain-containing protein [Myxococcota bacterium]|nr:PKD domain-containing protein [Myxococcota bacterium]
MFLLLACTSADLATLDAKLQAAWEDSSALDSGLGTWSTISSGAPVADAGEDQEVDLGQLASLDGSGSSDPDEDKVTWAWTLSSVPADSALTDADLGNADNAMCWFTGDVLGDFELQMTVSDATDSASDNVVVTFVAPDNRLPMADAGTDATGTVGDTLSFDASGSSDPDGDDLVYRWRFGLTPVESSLTSGDIEGRYTATPSFDSDAAGTYDLEVRAIDEGGFSADLAQAVVSAAPNSPPVPDTAGSPSRVAFTDYVQMQGVHSWDPDDDTLSFEWSFVAVPTGSVLTDTDWDSGSTDHGSFAPDAPGLFRIQLTVDDGTDSAAAVVGVEVKAPTADNPPFIDLAYDPGAAVGDTVSLDASASYDPEGETLSWRWSFAGVPAASALTDVDISGRSTDSVTFVPDEAGTYELKVVASDAGNRRSASPEVIVDVDPEDTAPVADAAADQAVPLGSEVYADGSGSYDPEGGALTYQWSLSSLPSDSGLTAADLAKPKSPVATFEPDVAGDYVLRLVIDDGTYGDADTVTFTVE